jgi:hypothetical protein
VNPVHNENLSGEQYKGKFLGENNTKRYQQQASTCLSIGSLSVELDMSKLFGLTDKSGSQISPLELLQVIPMQVSVERFLRTNHPSEQGKRCIHH